MNESPLTPLCVRGNCDAEIDQMVLNFPIMADYALLPLENGSCAFLTHGHLFNREQLPPHRPGDVLVNGHFHVYAAEPAGDMFYVNPGSAAQGKSGKELHDLRKRRFHDQGAGKRGSAEGLPPFLSGV